jgi:hypothetical protein
MKEGLLRMAVPYAVIRSPALQAVGGSADYFVHHVDFCSILRRYVTGPLAGGEGGGMFMLLTFSPLLDLEPVLGPPFMSAGEVGQIRVSRVADFKSEGQVSAVVGDFFGDPSPAAPSLLVLQCDPVLSPQALIDYAKYLAVQQRARCGGLGARVRRSVIVLVHMPPGIASRERRYHLDFYAPWTCLFVDDLRPEPGDQRTTFMELVTTPVYDFITSGRLVLKDALLSSVQPALARLTLPPRLFDEDSILPLAYSERMQLVRWLLEREPRFYTLVEACVMAMLLEQKRADSGKIQLHVRFASLEGGHLGSFRQSIHLALDTIIVRALMITLRQLDQDFNLALLRPQPTLTLVSVSDLWLTVAEALGLMEGAGVWSAGLSSSDQFLAMGTHGRRGPFAARCPFSHRVVQLLDDPEVKGEYLRAILREGGVTPREVMSRLERLCGDILLTPRIMGLWSEHGAAVDYLHDLTAMLAPPLTGLSFAGQLRVYRAVCRYTLPGCAPTPPWAHAAYMFNERRLFVLSLLVSNASVMPPVAEAVIASLEALAEGASAGGALAEMDIAVLWAVVERSFAHLRGGRERYAGFVGLCTAIGTDLEDLFLSLPQGAYPPALKQALLGLQVRGGGRPEGGGRQGGFT